MLTVITLDYMQQTLRFIPSSEMSFSASHIITT